MRLALAPSLRRAAFVWSACGVSSTALAAPNASPKSVPIREDCFVCYGHVLARGAVGGGLRFNNPFRLQTQLGDSPRNVSATAPHFDMLVAGLLGDPGGWQNGIGLGWSTALLGVPQDVVTPSYVTYVRLAARWSLHGRVGIPIVVRPDGNVGGELAAGAAWMMLGGIGIFADLIGGLYVGAATLDRSATTIPVLSAQAGFSLEYEVLP